MTDVELAIRMTADASDASRAMDDVGGSAKDMANEVESASRKVDDAGTRMTGAADAADGLGSSSAQAAGGLGDLGGALSAVPGPLGAVGSGMETVAPLVMGVTGATDLLSLAMNSNVVVSAKQAAATALNAAKTVVMTAATKTAAAGQWLLNAALAANPVGLVVVAIAALVAGLVLAYNKSETFRNIVQTAMRGAQTAVTWVVNAVQDVVDLVSGKASSVWNGISKAAETAKNLIVSYMQAITSPIQAVVDLMQKVIDKVTWLKDHGGALLDKALGAVGVGGRVGATTTAVPVPVATEAPVVTTTTVNVTVEAASDPYAFADQLIQILRRYGVSITGVV